MAQFPLIQATPNQERHKANRSMNGSGSADAWCCAAEQLAGSRRNGPKSTADLGKRSPSACSGILAW